MHLQSLTLDMYLCGVSLDPHGPAVLSMQRILALVPHALTLKCHVVGDEWLRPLLPALAAHSALHRVTVEALHVPQSCAACDLLVATAVLPRLRHLHLYEEMFEVYAAGMRLQRFSDDLQREAGLTALDF
eukprot:jgi/Ulvmu1/2547/UM139_0015.1